MSDLRKIIIDGIEVLAYGTDPTLPDTEGDGMDDGWEIQYGLDPLIDDAAGDLDGDGWSNVRATLSNPT